MQSECSDEEAVSRRGAASHPGAGRVPTRRRAFYCTHFCCSSVSSPAFCRALLVFSSAGPSSAMFSPLCRKLDLYGWLVCSLPASTSGMESTRRPYVSNLREPAEGLAMEVSDHNITTSLITDTFTLVIRWFVNLSFTEGVYEKGCFSLFYKYAVNML